MRLTETFIMITQNKIFFRRIIKLSPQEVWFRTVQKANIAIDRLQIIKNSMRLNKDVYFTPNLMREADSFLNSNGIDDIERRFFISFSTKEKTQKAVLDLFSTDLERGLEDAELIIGKQFDILGNNSVSFGNPICWHLDPLNSKKSPLRFWADINFLCFIQSGDHKVIWEVNRHQYLTTLGKAYWATGDEKYTQEWIDQIEHWMVDNPPKIGINWSSSLEVAYRSISWIWALLFFRDSKLVSEYFLIRYLYFLLLNGLHVERNLSYYFSPNTHLTGEALGLVYIGLLLSETEKGKRWLNKGISILLEQLERHILKDGVYFEQSTYYHRYTTDIYLHLYILMQRNSHQIPIILEDKLQKLLTFLVYTQKPDGKTPLIGDDDGGRLVFLSNDDYDDFRSSLSTGAVLFGRADCKKSSSRFSEETLWLLGPSAHNKYDILDSNVPSKTSEDFPTGGYYVMRNGWDDDAAYLLVDCGFHGWDNGGHAHSDLLSTVVSVKGRDLLIDPGTFTYTASEEWRDKFRGSLAHNTVSVDRLSQSKPGGPFSWESMAEPESCFWITHRNFDFFSGKSLIYKYFTKSVHHKREIFFVKNRGLWVISDKVRLDTERDTHLRFHFPSTLVDLKGNSFIASDGKEPYGVVSIFSSHPFKLTLEDDWCSPIYSIKKQIKTGVCHVPQRVSVETLTVIEPAFASLGWRHISSEGMSRLITLSDSKNVEESFVINYENCDKKIGDGLQSDFSWHWRRSDIENGSERLTAAKGSHWFLDNFFRLKFHRPVDYLIMEREKDGISLIFYPDSEYVLEALNESTRLNINGRRVR